MKQESISKFATALMVSIATLVAASPADAAPLFGLNQAASGGTYLGAQNVFGTQFNGNSSELLRFGPGDTTVSVDSGFLTFASIFNSNNSTATLLNSNSGTGTYGLYLLFSFTADYASGAPAGTAGSNYTISNLNFTVYADPTGNTTFQNASSAGAGTEATRTAGFGDDVVLGFGALAQPGATSNVAGFNAGGGAFVNSLESFAVCTGAGTATVGGVAVPDGPCTTGAGNSYFASPVPFYPLAFDAFNNTGNSLGVRNGGLLAITQATGVVSYQSAASDPTDPSGSGNQTVPEPSTVVLLGIATVAIHLSRRSRNKPRLPRAIQW